MRRSICLSSIILGVGFAVVAPTKSIADEPWILHPTGTHERLRGLRAINSRVAWASGTKGTWLRTTDGGKTWKIGQVPDATALDFRDLHAVDAETAYLLSSGAGNLSRIYKTTDGGLTWALQITNPDASGFWDALAFWDAEHGVAFGDPVDGKFVLFITENGGKSWEKRSSGNLPHAIEGEGAFAASGTCLSVGPTRRIRFATGGAKVARVFQTDGQGQTWTATETAIHAGLPSAGIFSLAFADDDHGVAIGGDYKNPDDRNGVAATTSDGGKTWVNVKNSPPGGYRSAVAFLSKDGKSLVAVGPSGADRSGDGGRTWTALGSTGFDSVVVATDGTVWASGEDGRVARLR